MADTEQHPLSPFLPPHACVLMLGSFPPPRKRWSMEFFYPNLQNDMWRIIGHLATGDKAHFLAKNGRFDRERIIQFCTEKGIALYDSATEVIRLKENASDEFLQVVQEVDLAALLAQIPACSNLVTTGGKSTEILCSIINCTPPKVGESVTCNYANRTLRVWRMPSSSRAFPRSVEWKADFYRKVFAACGIF